MGRDLIEVDVWKRAVQEEDTANAKVLGSVLLSWGCHNKYHKLGTLKQQTLSLSLFYRLEVQNQGVSRATLPSEALGKGPSLVLPASDGSRHPMAGGHIPEVSAYGFMWPSALSLCLLLICLL